MADVNQTVEISYAADISGLTEQLQKIPGMTKEQAQKMAKELTKGLAQTEKAAKKAANTTDKSMRKMEKSAKKAGASFKKLKSGASQIGRGLGELSLIAGGTDSAFGRLVDKLAIVGLSASALIPLVGGLRAAFAAMAAPVAGVVGGLALLAGGAAYAMGAFDGMTEGAKKQEESLASLNARLDGYRQAIERANIDTANYAKEISDSTDALKDMDDELDRRIKKIQAMIDPSLAEDIKEMENALAMETLKEKAEANFKAQEDAMLASLQRQKDAFANHKNIVVEMQKRLGEDEKAILDLRHTHITGKEWDTFYTIQKINKKIEESGKATDMTLWQTASRESGRVEITKQQVQAMKPIMASYLEMREAAKEIEKTEEKILKHRKEAPSAMDKIIDKMKQVLLWQKEADDMAEEEAEAEKRKAKAKEWANKEAARKAKMQAKINELNKIENQLIEKTLTKEEQKQLSYFKQLEALHAMKTAHDELIRKGEDELDISLAVSEIEAAKAKDKHELELKRLSELEERDKQRALLKAALAAKEAKIIADNHKKQIEGLNLVFSKNKGLIGSLLELEKNKEQQNQKAIVDLFNLQKALAIAEIGMAAAKGMANAVANYGPVLGAFVGASIMATAAAQTAVVASQAPPSAAAHMGTTAPDEGIIRVLSGEAVLDRSTTKRLGGEQGINQLLGGGHSSNEAIIIQPFRHFDRYNRSARRMRPIRAVGSKGY